MFTCQHCAVADGDVCSISVSYKKGDAVHGKWHPACFDQIRPTLERKGDRMQGICRNPPPSHPQSLDNPAHRENLMQFAGALGRIQAHHEFEAQRRKKD